MTSLHFVALVIRRLRRVHVEASAGAKVPAVVLACYIETSRRSVWVYDCDAVLRGGQLEEAFFCAIVARAGETREIEEDWYFGRGSLRWEVEVQCHGAVRGFRIMLELEEFTSARCDGCSRFEAHSVGVLTRKDD